MIDKRQHVRVQCFMLQRDRGVVPMWSFTSGAAGDAIAGLIVDCSDGGVQIVTDREVHITHSIYELEIQRDPQTAESIIEWFQGPIRHVWSRSEETLYATHGFALATGHHSRASAHASIAANLRLAEHRILRCTLTPSEQTLP